MRVAYRLPLTAGDLRITTGNSVSLVPIARTGPFPDESGGEVMWQGHETAPGDTTTVVMEYRLPAGTFAPGTYDVHADPQALAQPVVAEHPRRGRPGDRAARDRRLDRSGDAG